jgi:hypothetical protein
VKIHITAKGGKKVFVRVKEALPGITSGNKKIAENESTEGERRENKVFSGEESNFGSQ